MNVGVIILVVVSIIIIAVIIFWLTQPYPIQLSSHVFSCQNDAQCPGMLFCQDGVCLAPPGGPCTRLSDCGGDSTACVNGICVANPPTPQPGTIGGTCPCHHGLTCDGGVCRAQAGVVCTNDQECLSRNCANGTCAPVQPNQSCNQSIDQLPQIPDCSDQPSSCDDDSDITDQSPSVNTQTSSEGVAINNHKFYDIYTDSSNDKYSRDVYTSSSKESYNHTSRSYDSTSSSHFTPCYTSHDCPDGTLCLPQTLHRGYPDGSVRPVIQKEDLSGDNVIDLTINQGTTYILLEGGDLLLVRDNHKPTRVATGHYLIAITTFNQQIYGLSQGHVYRLTQSNQWEEVTYYRDSLERTNDQKSSHLPDEIIHISVCHDQSHFFVQTHTQGYLYNSKWELVDKIKLNREIRIYGQTKDDYLTITSNRIITSKQQTYPHSDSAAMLTDGYVLTANRSSIVKVKVVVEAGRCIPYFILDRTCVEVES